MKRFQLCRRVNAVGAALILWLALSGLVLVPARPALAQLQNGISEPQQGDTISGVVTIRGTATHETFLRYELAFNNGGDWIVFAEGQQSVVNGTLAIWDTSVGQPQNPIFPDGTYQLRLRVVRQDHNYDEYFVRGLTIANSGTQTPTPTATIEGATPEAQSSPTPVASGAESGGVEVERPTPLPTFTPFPTPSPVSGVADSSESGGAGPRGGTADEGNQGLLQQLFSVDTGRFSRAFWDGARIALYAFLLLPVYLVVRAIGRRLWRFLIVRLWR